MCTFITFFMYKGSCYIRTSGWYIKETNAKLEVKKQTRLADKK